MNEQRLATLFKRYIDNSCTEAERSELMAHIGEAENDTQIQSLMDDVWNNLPADSKLPAQKAEAILNEILKSKRKVVPIVGRRTLSLYYKVAAAILVIALSMGAVYFYINKPYQESILVENSASPVDHQFVKLPDGSTVVLNAGSKLDYPETFGKTREVHLTGEGYFDIKHDPTKPFIVLTGNLKTTVLGTAFNIKALPGDDNITVTVTRGKVKVEGDQKLLGVITPNQQITFNTKQLQGEQQNVDSRKAVAWMENDIFLDDITMAEAVVQLEERFNVKITFTSEKVKDCRFTATFVKGESVKQVLDVICEFNKAKYQQDKNGNVTISGDGCL